MPSTDLIAGNSECFSCIYLSILEWWSLFGYVNKMGSCAKETSIFPTYNKTEMRFRRWKMPWRAFWCQWVWINPCLSGMKCDLMTKWDYSEFLSSERFWYFWRQKYKEWCRSDIVPECYNCPLKSIYSLRQTDRTWRRLVWYISTKTSKSLHHWDMLWLPDISWTTAGWMGYFYESSYYLSNRVTGIEIVTVIVIGRNYFSSFLRRQESIPSLIKQTKPKNFEFYSCPQIGQ